MSASGSETRPDSLPKNLAKRGPGRRRECLFPLRRQPLEESIVESGDSYVGALMKRS